MMMNRPALAMLAAMAVASLAACQKESAPGPASGVDATQEAATSAATDTSAPGGRLVLPVIAGRPAAAYIAWRNTGSAPVTITGITIADTTSAGMHETKGGAMLPLATLTLAPGEEANFVPGGRHVMVYGLKAGTKAGDAIAYHLLLSDGGKLSGTLTVEGAVSGHDTGHDMAGMKM